MTEEFDIGVVGAGYVGLVTGACLARLGHRVTCVDSDAERVARLKEGRVPIYEPGLEALISRTRERLRFTTELTGVVSEADILFIAVDTPQDDDGTADLSSVAAVARSIGRALAQTPARRARPLVVVNKSTVPVGSGDYVSMLIQEGAAEAENGAVDYRVVSNPEFLREGSAIYDSLFPDRIVHGPRMRPDDGRMIPNFMTQALSGRALTIYGDGSQSRSLQYVEDLIEGTFLLMRSQESRPVNIGNPVEYSVREVARMVTELCGRDKSELIYEPLPEDDPKQRCPDISRAREVLGWEPRVPAREGLSRTLRWFAGRAGTEAPSAGR